MPGPLGESEVVGIICARCEGGYAGAERAGDTDLVSEEDGVASLISLDLGKLFCTFLFACNASVRLTSRGEIGLYVDRGMAVKMVLTERACIANNH